MTKIVAFDLATVVGCAVGAPHDNAPRLWTVDLTAGGKGVPEARKLSRAHRMVRAICETHKPDLIVIEGAVGGPKSSMFLVRLIGVVMAAANLMGVPVQEENIGAIRVHFIGGNITSASKQFKHIEPAKRKAVARAAAKAAVIGRCAALGWTVTNDNEADAAALWSFKISRINPAHRAATTGNLFDRGRD